MFTNVWYVAALSSQLTDDPLPVTLLGADLVLFRDHEGVARCISNICPHRGSSLALGTLYKDGTLACPFHGWRFDGAGRCTLIPSRRDHEVDAIVARARTDAYPVIERYGLVWVLAGDDPDNAYPLFDMPEWDAEGWRVTVHEEIWEADIHTAKLANLDYVHLPVVHGILFQGHENPIQAPEHSIRATDAGFEAVMRVDAAPSEGVWSTLREKGAQVESVLKFFVPGFTLRGQVEIGGIGSGRFNVFYEFSTPLDERRTMMRHYFLRNYKLDPAFDTEHLRRNLQNVHQDKRLAEAQRPRGVAVGPSPRGLYTHDEDKVALAYWKRMEIMRDKGWQLDTRTLDAHARETRVHVLPSPARRAHPDGWVFDAMPRLPAAVPGVARVDELHYTDVDALTPTRAKNYGDAEPVKPQDAKSNTTLEWEASALARIEKAPAFVQPMIIENAEREARERGTLLVTVALLEELQARQAAEG